MKRKVNKAQPLQSEQTAILKQRLRALETDPNATLEDVKETAIAAIASVMGDMLDYEYAQQVLQNLVEKK